MLFYLLINQIFSTFINNKIQTEVFKFESTILYAYFYFLLFMYLSIYLFYTYLHKFDKTNLFKRTSNVILQFKNIKYNFAFNTNI